MRVLAIVAQAFGGYGGISRYNRDLFEAMSALDCAPLIDVLPRYAPDPVGRLPDRVRQHRAQGARAALAIRAVRLAERLRPDLVFCGHLHLSPLAAWIARRGRSALMCQAHGVEVWPRPSELRRRSMEAADVVLCVSRDTRAQVRNWIDMPPERLRVVPNTVGPEFTPGASSARQLLSRKSQKVILSVSRLDAGQRHKGQDRIIQLLPRLTAGGLDVVYWIAGEGDDAPRLQALANDVGVGDRVRLLGKVSQADLPDLYRAADLFALPSTGDGFGIVFLEAMACGVPTVGLDVGGVADALGDGELGLVSSEAGLEDTLIDALSADKHDNTLAARVRARFDHSAFKTRVQTVFNAAVAHHAVSHDMARA